MPGEGIDKEVITADLARCGRNDASVQPGTYQEVILDLVPPFEIAAVAYRTQGKDGRVMQGYYIALPTDLSSVSMDPIISCNLNHQLTSCRPCCQTYEI